MSTWTVTNRLTGEVAYAYGADAPDHLAIYPFDTYNHTCAPEIVEAPKRRLTKLELIGRMGEAGAVTVNNAAGTPITGTISAASFTFDYDYDGNTQAGFTAGTDRAVTLIGIRPGYGKFAVATGTLTRSKSISLSLVAEADRAYV